MTTRQRMRPAPAWKAVPILALALLAMIPPATASGHVNRTVGPYTILVTLIGEPYFTTNRAGFELWVTNGGRPVGGLDETLRTQAIGVGGSVGLRLTATPDGGHYRAEVDAHDMEFDPGRGGAWSLHLSGSIDELVVDETFAVIFPAYPRVNAAGASTSAAVLAVAPSEQAVSWPSGAPIAIGAGLLCAGLLVCGSVLVTLLGRRARSIAASRSESQRPTASNPARRVID
jgi:hypothetical protein